MPLKSNQKPTQVVEAKNENKENSSPNIVYIWTSPKF